MSERYGHGVTDEMLDELAQARAKFGTFNSPHEGYSLQN